MVCFSLRNQLEVISPKLPIETQLRREPIVTDLITVNPPNNYAVGFIKDFPQGIQGNELTRIEGGLLAEKLIDHYQSRIAYHLLTLEPEVDGKTVTVDYLDLFYYQFPLTDYL